MFPLSFHKMMENASDSDILRSFSIPDDGQVQYITTGSLSEPIYLFSFEDNHAEDPVLLVFP
jgi:hypothetical protein